jgi:hypothetical protein
VNKTFKQIIGFVLIVLSALVIFALLFINNSSSSSYILKNNSQNTREKIEQEINFKLPQNQFKLINCAFEKGFQASGEYLLLYESYNISFEEFSKYVDFEYAKYVPRDTPIGDSRLKDDKKCLFVEKTDFNSFNSDKLPWLNLNKEDILLRLEAKKNNIIIYFTRPINGKTYIHIDKFMNYTEMPSEISAIFHRKIDFYFFSL